MYMTQERHAVSSLIKYFYKVLLALSIVYINYTSLLTKNKGVVNIMFYLWSAFAYWLLLEYVRRAITAKICKGSLNLIRSIDKFYFITTFGFIGLLVTVGIAVDIFRDILPLKFVVLLTYLLSIIFQLLQINFSYTLGRAFSSLKVQSNRQRWFCWMIGNY